MRPMILTSAVIGPMALTAAVMGPMVLTAAVGLAACGSAVVTGQWASPRGEVLFPDKTRVSVEIARTPEERSRGLMFRERMGPEEGMVFVFEEPGSYPFWMKNTLIPLDMIWLDKGRRVVHIAHSVPPCKADPCPSFPHEGQALYVVEVNSGFAKKHGVKVGDKLELKDVEKK
jgi:uncharacterized membrane protein (UPF0127 family)